MPEPVTLDRLHELLDAETIPMTHRTLWLLLWQGGADREGGGLRLADLLSLDVRDVDMMARTAPVDFPKLERDPRTVRFSELAAAGLTKVIGDRAEGPVFVSESGGPLSREAALRTARRVGVDLHGFRLGGQLAAHCIGSHPAPSSLSSQA